MIGLSMTKTFMFGLWLIMCLDLIMLVMPSGVSRYQILEEIRGKYYHKYTSNIFASIGNFIFGKNSFIEKSL